MRSVFNSLSVLNVLIFSWQVEPAPTFITQPSNPSFVDEGSNLTLRWTYNIDGTLRTATFIRSGTIIITEKDPSGIFVNPSYVNRTQVAFSDGETTIILLGVNSSESGDYKFEVQNNARQRAETTVKIIVRVPPNITHISGNQTVIEGRNVILNCTGSGVLAPNITWTRLSDNSTVTMPLINIRRLDQGGYRCTADNDVGIPATRDTYIIVHFPPNITDISEKQTVDEGDIVALNCTADGNPAPNITWTRVSDNSPVNRLLNISGKEVEGFYRCTASNGIGIADRSDVFICVQNYRPTETNLTTNLTNNTVVLNDPFNLMCKADANPPAHYRLYKQQQPLTTITDNQTVGTFTTSIGERMKQVTYSCTPNNSFGVGQSDTAIVTVHFSPSASSSGRNETVPLGQPFTFTCPVNGNPPPSVRWYKGSEPSGTVLSSENEYEFTSNSLSDTGLYTCFASNYLGNTNVSFGLKVVAVIPSSSATPAKPVPDVQVECRVTNKNCRVPGDVEQVNQEFPKEVYSQTKKRLPQLESVNGSVTGCGSVIVNLVLRFNQSVSENEVILILKDGARSGSFGQFTVDPDSVKLANTGREPTKGPPPCKKSFFQNDDCSDNLLHLILIIVAAVVLIVVIAAAVAYWIHKKRKCRKDTRIAHDPGSEEQKLQGGDPYAQGNNGYAESGPPSANGTKKAAAAVPDYAVVDKPAKKKNKEDRGKSSEKKNKNVDDTYAKVDMSKKSSKKKPRSGEDMLYADLGDFNGASQMPTVATSPKAQAQLPPFKRPEPYEGTQYADITQFLKGDATFTEDDKQGTELKEKDEKTDGAGGENVPKEVEQF